MATVVILLAGLVVVGLAVGEKSTPPTDSRVPPGQSAPVSTAAITAAFPDIARKQCQRYAPQPGEYTTGSGVQASVIFSCAYADVAPDATVYYLQWPTQAAANEYQAGLRVQHANLDNKTTWSLGTATLGQVWTAQSTPTSVWSMATYDSRPFSFEIDARNVQDADNVFAKVTLLPPEQVPMG